MKINELISAKQARKEITSRDAANRKLEQHGFELLSDLGQHSTIWQHPSLDYVLKVYDKGDRGYARFVDLVKRNQTNPHFPKLRGSPVSVTPDVVALRLEKLSPWKFDRNDPDHAAIDWLLAYIDEPKWKDHFNAISDANLKASIKRFIKKWPQFTKAIGLMVDAVGQRGEIGFDLHDDNIMMRGNCPVIIDPFAPI